jgi:CHAD domain-containing protein
VVLAAHNDARKFAFALTREFLGRLVSQIQRTLRSPGVDEVHDLRVAIRRLDQVLRVFKPQFRGKEAKRVHRELKKHLSLAGDVRDLDIATGLLAKSKLSEAAGLRSKFDGRRNESAQALNARLRDWTKRRTAAKWRRKLLIEGAGEGTRTVADVAREVLPRLAGRFFAVGERAAGAVPRVEPLHKLRIAGKKLRYSLEVFAPLHESVLRSRIGQLKELQGLLGDIHDAEAVQEMVMREGGGRKLEAELAKRRDKRVSQFTKCWEEEFAGTADRWRKDVTSFPGPRKSIRKPPARSESARRLTEDASLAARVAD